MATLRDRLGARLRSELAERVRIEEQAATNLAEVDERIKAIGGARDAITDEVEAAYAALVKFGLIKEIE
jgi:hypothetical protein